MAYTGGELNWLNGAYGISAPHKSVPVMKLIKNHRPKSKDELYILIKYHHENDCNCGVKSQGSVEDFGSNLFNAQSQAWKQEKYTLQQCIQWEYDLFVVQSLKGTLVEDKAIRLLISELPKALVEEAEGFVDEELRIDLIIKFGNEEVCGIQVKPLTFKLMRQGVIAFNTSANAKWGKPVFYLYYDGDEKFTNLNEVTNSIKRLLPI
mgnify:CR=1 FL=1